MYKPVSNNAVVVEINAIVAETLLMNENIQMIRPYANGNVGTVKVRVRRTVYISPHIYELYAGG